MFEEVIALAKVNLSEKRAAYTELYTLYKKHGSLPSMKSAVDALANEMTIAEQELYALETRLENSRSDLSMFHRNVEKEREREPIRTSDSSSMYHYMDGVREEPLRVEPKRVGFRTWDSIQRVPTRDSSDFGTSGKTDQRVKSKAVQHVTYMGSEDSYTPSYRTEMSTNGGNHVYTRDFDSLQLNTSSGIWKRTSDDYDAYSGDFDSTNSSTYRRSTGYSKPTCSRLHSRDSIRAPSSSRSYAPPKPPTFSSEYPTHSKIAMSSQTCSKPISQPRADNRSNRPSIGVSQTQGMAVGGTPLDATCIWFNEVTGEQMLFPKGVDPGAGYRSLYINPR